MKVNRLNTIGHSVVTCGLAAALALGGLAGCAGGTTTSQTTAQTASAASAGTYVSLVDTSALFTDRDLTSSYEASEVTATIALADGATKVDGTGVTVTDDIVTITQAGIYEVSGTLSGGQLRVDAKDAKVQIVLKDASITGGSSAALYVKEADKVFVTLPEGSSNKLVTSGAFIAIDENDIDGVIFAKDDLTINGTGSLSVSTNYGHGIVGKDEVTLVSGTVNVDVSGDAIKANDSLAVKDGTYNLACDGKALEVSNSDDATLGNVYVEGGTISISAVDDALNASGKVQIDGGTWNVTTGDDGFHADSDLVFNGGNVSIGESVEGIEGSTITVTNGDISVTSSDDGVNAVGTSGGTSGNDMGGFGGTVPMTGDVSQTPDGTQVPTSGNVPVAPDGQMPTPPDGGQMMAPPSDGQTGGGPMGGQRPSRDQMPESGQAPTPPDGGQMPDGQAPSAQTTPSNVVPQQDTNPTSPTTDGSAQTQGFGGRNGMDGGRGFGGMGGGMMMDADETAKFTITGGKLTINAGGDGLDSNGTVSIEGGEIYVSGATNSGNAALDFGLSGTISGGVFVATGMSGMVEMLSEESSQASAVVYLDSNASGTVTLKDGSGKTLASFDAPKEYNCVLVSAPGMSESGTYKLTSGSTETEIAMSGKVTTVGNAANQMGGGMGGFGGGMGGHGGMGGGRGPRGNMDGMGGQQGMPSQDQTGQQVQQNTMQMQPTTSA